MPIYEYYCPKCRREFELLRSMNEADKPAFCPSCGAQAERLISGFATWVGSFIKPSEAPLREKREGRSS